MNSQVLLISSFLAEGLTHSCEVLMLGYYLDRIKVDQEIHTNLNIRSAIYQQLRQLFLTHTHNKD